VARNFIIKVDKSDDRDLNSGPLSQPSEVSSLDQFFYLNIQSSISNLACNSVKTCNKNLLFI
jgi:hypothetical protein